ncbi:MAG: hypothetical protein IPI67_09565 [Myxococcales bacterium]|nr:hypothetical protein [Myxococcales bacterium]
MRKLVFCLLMASACGESDGGSSSSGGSGGMGAGTASGGSAGAGLAGGTGATASGGVPSDAGDDASGGTAGSGANAGSGGVDAGPDAASDASDGAAGTAGATGNAMWVWQGDKFVDATARSALLSYAKSHGVSRLFVSAYPTLLASSPKYAPAAWRKGLEDAATQAIVVEVLFGDPTWTSPGADQTWAINNLIVPLAQFVSDPSTKVKPAALHFDVEPHGLAGWGSMSDAEHQKLIADLCDFFVLTRQKLDAGGAQSLAVHADLPSWWDSSALSFSYAGKQATGYEHALGRLDAVALMAYSNSQASVLANSAKEVGFTDAAGKRLWIGVETDPAHASDAFVTKSALDSALGAIGSSYSGHASYAGWAVHEYAYWSVMP